MITWGGRSSCSYYNSLQKHDSPCAFNQEKLSLKSHTGEISFPGGQYSSAQDLSLLDTALRETKEEVGLSFRPEDILGQLESVYTLTSNYSIIPFVTIQKNITTPKIFANEVECVINVPLEETLAYVST